MEGSGQMPLDNSFQLMKKIKNTKRVDLQQTIYKITKRTPRGTQQQKPNLMLLNRTARSSAQQKNPQSRKSSSKKHNSVYAQSPVNSLANKYDSYFRFVKDENIKLNLNQTCIWNRAVKTPLPTSYVVPKIDEKRRSVVDEKRYKRASESPYLRSNKDKDVKKKLLIEGKLLSKKRAQTPKSRPRQSLSRIEKPADELLQQQAQRQLFKGIQFFRDLGRGAHALVRSAVDWKKNRKIAVKVYKKQQLTEEELCNIQREVEILQEIDHPGIAMLYDIIQTPKTINLIMEYGGGNSLHQYLRSRPEGRFEQGQAKTLFRQILDAINYLQKKNIVHRDIKPQNILLNKLMKVKIIDFGFSLMSSVHDKVTTFCGTPTYMAPEIVNKREHVGIYADRWSLGVLLYTMLQGIYPFRATTQKQLFKKITKGAIQYPVEITTDAKDLIQHFIKLAPHQRISPEAALQHRWMLSE